MSEWDVEKGCYGVRLKYEGNMLYCSAYRTTEENKQACLRALAVLLNTSVEVVTKMADDPNEMMTLELYRSYGAS